MARLRFRTWAAWVAPSGEARSAVSTGPRLAQARLFPLPRPVLGGLLKIARQPDAYESLIGSLKLDLSKAASTGWRPPVTLDEGLRRALAETEVP